MDDFPVTDESGNEIAHWYEPSLDEIVSSLEYAYFNREAIRKTGKAAGEFMKSFTWDKAVDKLVDIFRQVVEK
jgi:hypothetical protein